MKTCFRIALKVVAFFLLCSLLACLWWQLWLYRGVWGGFDLLRPFVWSDGESSYDRKFVEMWLQICLLLGAGIAVLAKLPRLRNDSRSA